MHVCAQLQAHHVTLVECPSGRESHRARCDAATASLGPYPVADLGHAVRMVLPTDAARAENLARSRIGDGERPEAAVLPAAAARGNIGAGVRARVRRGNVVDPARDLGIAAGLGDHRHVAVRPGAQEDDAVGQWWVWSAKLQEIERSAVLSPGSMQQRGRVLAVTGAAAVAAAGIASALPGAGTAWNQPVQLQQANVRVRGAAEDDRLGWSVAGVGDVNGDRRLDVAVGAPFSANNGRASSGSAHVLYGPFAAAADLDVGAAGVRGFRIDGAAEGDFAAGSIAAGDVNGDRRSDLLIGAPETDNNERGQSGSVYVVFGGARSGQLDLATLAAGFRIDGAEDGDQTGWSVGRAGDVNGDGRADMVVGAPLADSNDRIESGSAFVVLGKGSTDGIDLSFSPSVRLRMDGADTRERAGWSVAGAGDVNGDKRPDVVVGAPWANPNGRFFAGSVYVVFGQAASTTIDLAAPGRPASGSTGRPTATSCSEASAGPCRAPVT